MEWKIVVGNTEVSRMRQHGADGAGWTAAHPAPRRTEEPGVGGVPSVLLGLQRSAGNAAVAGHLGGPHRQPTSAAMAFVQRCGPTPCNCSAEERADYAEEHPEEPVSPEAETADAGHDHG